jgi:hypothetical protein
MTELVIFYESKSMNKFSKAEEIQMKLENHAYIANHLIEQRRKEINRIIENIDALRPFAATQVSNSTEISPKQKAVLATVMTELVTIFRGKSIYKFLKTAGIQAQLEIAAFTAYLVIEQELEDIDRIYEDFYAHQEFFSTQVSNSTEFSPKTKTFLLAFIRNQVLDVAEYDEMHPSFGLIKKLKTLFISDMSVKSLQDLALELFSPSRNA